jgi:hypothetical protein
MGNYRSARASWKDWLADRTLNVLVTVTLKQGLANEPSSWVRLTPEDCVRTGWLLRDRVTKAVLGSARYRRGERFPFLTFLEGGAEKRFHLHICAAVPSNVPVETFKAAFADVAAKLDWVHRGLDFRDANEVNLANSLRLMNYTLKEGTDAFLPEASSL